MDLEDYGHELLQIDEKEWSELDEDESSEADWGSGKPNRSLTKIAATRRQFSPLGLGLPPETEVDC